jgi:2,3-dihydroxyphenylpropionate 1,2-dioxygenase
MRRCGDWIRELDPSLIIQFAPDHYNGFFYDLMPSFCIGAKAEAVGDWAGLCGQLNVPGDIALRAVEAVREADVDLSISFDMRVDHGFVQFLQMTLGSLEEYPLLPVMLNCVAPPMPSFRRARMLGEALGNFAKDLGGNVLFVGSGGLSHDPPLPTWEGANEAQRAFMLRGRNPSPDQRKAREERVRNAAECYAGGEGGALAPSEAWDRAVIAMFERRDLEQFDSWQDDEVTAVGGIGGHEVKNWVAAFAALSTACPEYRTTVDYQEIVPEWMTGMAIVRASA